MTLSYKDKYIKLQAKNDALTRDVKSLVNHLMRIRKKCSENNLWLSMGLNPHAPLVDEAQQGPMVSKLFDLAIKLKEKL